MAQRHVSSSFDDLACALPWPLRPEQPSTCMLCAYVHVKPGGLDGCVGTRETSLINSMLMGTRATCCNLQWKAGGLWTQFTTQIRVKSGAQTRASRSSFEVLDWRPSSEIVLAQSASPSATTPISKARAPSIQLILPASAFVTSYSHDAGHTTTVELGAAESSRQEHLCDNLDALCRHHQESAHQRRHKGTVPGLHRKAGDVSGNPSVCVL